MTKKTLAAAIGALALFGASCGGSDGSSGDAAKIADKMMSTAKEQGLELDKSCVTELAEKLNDADTGLLIDNLDNEDFDSSQLSDEGEALGMQMIGCADKDALVDMMMEQIGSVPGLDADCVRGVLEEIDPSQLATIAGDGDTSGMDDLSTKMMACMAGS